VSPLPEMETSSTVTPCTLSIQALMPASTSFLLSTAQYHWRTCIQIVEGKVEIKNTKSWPRSDSAPNLAVKNIWPKPVQAHLMQALTGKFLGFFARQCQCRSHGGLASRQIRIRLCM
jgi:hypothetical protein